MKMMKKPNLAVLDGDILIHRAAWWADGEGIDMLEPRLHLDIDNWSDGHDKYVVAFSCNRADNYRRDYFPLYKINRAGRPEPECLSYAREIVEDRCSIIERDRIEADDILGMMCSRGLATAVTIDKDLKSCPGWHWNPDKDDKPHYISEEEADLNLYCQWISGDLTDNIFGVWNWGPKKARKLLENTPREEWDSVVGELFRENPRPEHKRIDEIERMDPCEYALSQAICVRILRDGEFNRKTEEIKLWIPDLSHVVKEDTHFQSP